MPLEAVVLSSSYLLHLVAVLLNCGIVLTVTALWLDSRRRNNPFQSPAGCRRLGLEEGTSNLADQYDPRYARARPQVAWPDSRLVATVKALCIYPVKSCYPVELSRGEVVRTGMQYDRQFTFAQLTSSVAQDASCGITHQWNFITQRQAPCLTKVKTEVWVPDPASPTYSSDAEYVKSGGCIVVKFPYTDDKLWLMESLERLGAKIRATFLPANNASLDVSFRIPIWPTPERIKSYPIEKMKIWNEMPDALNMGNEIPDDVLAKLKYSLGISNPLTLFRTHPDRCREVFRCAPRKEDVGYQPVVGMADAYPLHIMSLSSVHDVAKHLPKDYSCKLDAIRYRANIYISGSEAYDEDQWKRIRIGSQDFHVSCRTARCLLPNVNPLTGERDKNQPYSAMSAYRKIDRGAWRYPCLGMQMVPVSGEPGEIRVGDEVMVLEVGDHHYIPQGT
ncbi:MOSC-domain-containing protein [Saccharata proteae CBS 121410]|uniref:MOSC-domain-containing protein n=1 Tax=Saccharata proteae CBS 121410 TaxID=1314787 RepID=A0A9P4M062_9PEZI|nr:MOSC-domain-containing protein [Saccharata proteae CBS 121410]